MSVKQEIAKKYISFLQEGELQSIQSLFAKDALVHSPVYGTMKANKFYEILLKDTDASILELKGIFEETGINRVAIHFLYTWILKNKKEVHFEVVDIIELNEFNLITDLKIIYDTVHSRKFVEALKE